MAVLIDTNILLRSTQPHHPHYAPATGAVAALLREGEERVVAVQNLVEFWAVATRSPKDNGLGLSFEEELKEISIAKRLLRVLPENNQVLAEWERLVSTHRISGKNSHDARLVAAMNLNGIVKILTFNTQDFIRFNNIQVLHPESIG